MNNLEVKGVGPFPADKLSSQLHEVSSAAKCVAFQKQIDINEQLKNLNPEKQRKQKKIKLSLFGKKDETIATLENKIKQLNRMRTEIQTLAAKLEKAKRRMDITEIRRISDLIDKAPTDIQTSDVPVTVSASAAELSLKVAEVDLSVAATAAQTSIVTDSSTRAAPISQPTLSLSERIKTLDRIYQEDVSSISSKLERIKRLYQAEKKFSINSLATQTLDAQISRIQTLQTIISQGKNVTASTELHSLCRTMHKKIEDIEQTHGFISTSMVKFRKVNVELKNLQATIGKDQNINLTHKFALQKKLNHIVLKLSQLESALLKGEAPTKEQAEKFAENVGKIAEMLKEVNDEYTPVATESKKLLDDELEVARYATSSRTAAEEKDKFVKNYAGLYDTISILKNMTYPEGLTSAKSFSETAVKELEAHQKKLDTRAEEIKKRLYKVQVNDPKRGDKYRAIAREYTQLANDAKAINEQGKKLLEAIEEHKRLGQLMQVPSCRLSKAEGVTSFLEDGFQKAQAQAKNLTAFTESLELINSKLNTFAETELLANWVLIESVYQRKLYKIVELQEKKDPHIAIRDREKWRRLKEEKAALYDELKKANFSEVALNEYIKDVAKLIEITLKFDPITEELTWEPKSKPKPRELVLKKIEPKE